MIQPRLSTRSKKKFAVFRKRWQSRGFSSGREFAKACEISLQTLYRVLGGEMPEGPRKQTLAKIAAAFSWPVSRLEGLIEDSRDQVDLPSTDLAQQAPMPPPAGDPEACVRLWPPPGLPADVPVWAVAVLRPLHDQGVPIAQDRQSCMEQAYQWLSDHVMRGEKSEATESSGIDGLEEQLVQLRRMIETLASWAEPARPAHLPVIGTIAAGSPIEAVTDRHGEGIRVPEPMTRGGAYGLRVRGFSMVDDAILDGDIVVVEPVQEVADGSVAVALLEDGSVTLKRVYRERNRVRLQPANPALDPIFASNVRIQGKVRGVVRWIEPAPR